MRKIILLAITFVTVSVTTAQDFSNKGKDFWLCFPQHVPNSAANFAVLSIFITSDKASSGTITMPNGAFSGTFNIAANGIQEIQIPWNANIHISNGESSNENVTQILKKAIRVKVNAGQPAVVAYAQQWAGARSAATLLLPVNVLGRKYYAISFTQNGSNFSTYNARSQFQIIATKPNTVVEITPVKNGVKGVKFTVNFPLAGDMIQYQSPDGNASTQDITGTYIESVASGAGGCLPIAVYSGSSNNTFGTQTPNCSGSSYDPLWQQLYPSTTWGKNFGFIPFADYLNRGNPYRVMASEDNTSVYFNGTLVATLNTGQIYPAAFTSNPVTITTPTKITADKPICVAQYAQADACTGYTGNPRVGDPDMVILNPIEQNISDITVFSSTRQNITRQWVNVLIQNTGIPSFKISRNGGPLNPPAAAWIPFAALPGYSYLQESLIGVNSARLVSDSGFNAICYGWGNVESYAYSAGTNVRDLYQQIGVQTQYGIETTPSVCTNSPFHFKVSLPYCADSIRWDLSLLPGPPVPAIDTIRYSTCLPGPGGPDSTTVVNGVTLYWYSLPTLYSFPTIGTFPVSMITYAPNSSGCGSEQLIDFDLQISDPPIASYTWTPGGCVAEPYQFTETTPQIPKATYRWWWDFDDPGSGAANNSLLRNPTHTFSTPGLHRVRYSSITTPGCLSDTLEHDVIVPDLPSATISGNNTSVCLNAAPPPDITFTGSAGTPPYTFTYNINGGAPLTVNSLGVSTSVTIQAPTNVAGTFVYNLIKVQNVGSTLCIQNISGQSVLVTINPLPNAAITGGTTVCLNSAPPPVTFTGSGGTAPYTFAYSINGVPQTPVVSNGAGIFTINAPTNVAGVFNYTITLVTDASSTLCSSVTNVSTVITVNDLPNAAISGTTAVCLNAAQPPVTFTGSGGTAPYTFNYTLNGVPQPPLVSNAAGIATVNAPTNVAGTFTYALVDVREGSPITCFRGGLTGTTVITVNPIPAAAIAGAITVCLNAAQPPVTFTGSGGTAPYTFAYTINGIPQPPVVSNASGVYIINAPTNVAGTFNYTITLVTDASSTLCSAAPNVSTIITVNDLPNAAISGATAVCLNAPQPTVTFTGSGGTAPYIFNYTINGVAQPPLISNGAGIATVTAPTNVAGPFTYALVSVQEGSPVTCIRGGLTGTTLITVNPLPSAAISGATAVCLNAPTPFITFTGSGATAPYTFTYTINGVPQPPLVSNAAGVATIAVPTGVAGTFTYVLTNVRDASSTLCTQVITGQQAIVIVHPLPTADFTYTMPTCDTREIIFTDNSTPNAGSITGWAWDFGDPASGANNTSTLQNPVHIFTAPNPPGPGYTVTLTATTSNGCSNAVPFSKIVVVNHRPVAGFIVPDVCINDVATVFTDTSHIAVGTIVRTSNQWNYGDPGSGPNNTSVGINGSHLYTATGVYQVTQIVTSGLGCKDTIVLPITINSADPVSNFTAGNSCSSDSVSLVNLSTVGFGSVTRLDIYWDNVGAPAVFQTILNPTFNGVYKHKYPTLQVNTTYNIRMVAYSGVICSNQKITPVTVYATPRVQFNNIPNTCYLVAPFQLTQGSEIGGVPGTGTYSGPGITNPNGTFNPQIAGIGTHNITYTWTASNAGACIDTLTRTITVLDTAHAVFSVVLPSCEQLPTSFTDLSTAPASVVLANTVWNFNDGNPIENHAPGSTFGHIFPGPGTYTVTMHNVSAVGCLSTDTSALINIDPNHGITLLTANSSQTLCVNVAIQDIKYQLSGGATNIVMPPTGLPPGVTASVSGNVVTLTGRPTLAGTYNYSIQTLGNTCRVANASGIIKVNPDDIISRNSGDSAQSVCVNTAIDPIVYDLGGGATSASVSGLPPGVSGLPTPGNTFTISGTPTSYLGSPFNFTIQTNGNCLKANASGQIAVHAYPVPDFTVDKPDYCIPNAIVKFTNASTTPDGSGMTYVWDFGDGSPLEMSVNPTHWYTSGVGPFTVRLTATSIAVPILNGGIQGCVNHIDSIMSSIHPQPQADFAKNKPSICIGDNVIFTDDTRGGGLLQQSFWDMGDGTPVQNGNPITYRFRDTLPSPFVITYYSQDNFGCYSDTITKQFYVYPYPHVNAGPDRFVLEGGSIQLETITYAIDPQYNWTPAQYLSDSHIARPRVNDPRTDMTYRLTVTGRGGCALSDDVFVKLLKFPVIPNTFTPNNDGINDTWRIDFLNTYPNNRVQIFTRSGKLVFESRGYNTPWDGTIKGKPLPFDTYYYIIEPGNGRDPITGYVTIIK